MNNKIEEQEFGITTFGNEFVMFASASTDNWSDTFGLYAWKVLVYKATQIDDHPAAYAHQKPLYHRAGGEIASLDQAVTSMHDNIDIVERMYADGSLAKRDGMFIDVSRKYMDDIKYAAQIGGGLLMRLSSKNGENADEILRVSNKLFRALKQLEGWGYEENGNGDG